MEKLNTELKAAQDQRDACKRELRARPQKEGAEMSKTTENARISTLTAHGYTHKRNRYESALGRGGGEFQSRLENELRSFMDRPDIFPTPAAKRSREDADD